jgi:hypothetical protein
MSSVTIPSEARRFVECEMALVVSVERKDDVTMKRYFLSAIL